MTEPERTPEERLRYLESMHRDMTPEAHRDAMVWLMHFRARRRAMAEWSLGTLKLAARILFAASLLPVVYWIVRSLWVGLLDAARSLPQGPP